MILSVRIFCIVFCFQNVRREVQKFANEMVSGREAWAEVQKNKNSERSLRGERGNRVPDWLQSLYCVWRLVVSSIGCDVSLTDVIEMSVGVYDFEVSAKCTIVLLM